MLPCQNPFWSGLTGFVAQEECFAMIYDTQAGNQHSNVLLYRFLLNVYEKKKLLFTGWGNIIKYIYALWL